MTPKKWKQIILGLLACVMAYIWWGNIELLWLRSNTSVASVFSPERQAITAPHSTCELKQYDVKANPFRRWGVPSAPAPAPRNIPPAVMIPRLSERMHLVGVLVESDHPQAVLRINDTGSVVLTHGDILEGWSLVGVGKDRVWFGCDSILDTLYLYENND
jgi:hypothetical protein